MIRYAPFTPYELQVFPPKKLYGEHLDLNKDSEKFMRTHFGLFSAAERDDAIYGFLADTDYSTITHMTPFQKSVLMSERYVSEYD